jgi:hypothetical protein
MLKVIMTSVIMLTVHMPSVIWLNVFANLNIAMLNLKAPRATMLGVSMSIVTMLSVKMPGATMLGVIM